MKSFFKRTTRPFRRAYYARKRPARNYKSDHTLYVQFSRGLSTADYPQLNATLAFVPSNHHIEILESPNNLPEQGIGAILGRLQKLKANSFLFVGSDASGDQITALNLLGIKHAKIIDLPKTDDQTEYPLDDPMRTRWHRALAGRPVLYSHFEARKPLLHLLKHINTVRRNYPTLIWLVSGVNEADFSKNQTRLNVVCEPQELRDLSMVDVLILKDQNYSALHSSLAQAQLVLPGQNAMKIADIALLSGASIVFYNTKLDEDDPKSDMLRNGTIWNVPRAGALSAALSQALDVETSANTLYRNIDQITDIQSPIVDIINDLFLTEKPG